ncbi:hypothetical protein Pmani_027125 [Petrolisthes manimaculis]|uniref:Uncharacterized protein n=1 Tax=Petrolisthes manimaculis TaxID=1843537 RepID=A0AAE1P4M9_9EUCA|nr:hypothetical protein Pmani_027125 [Petrolisthes manimaculis]
MAGNSWEEKGGNGSEGGLEGEWRKNGREGEEGRRERVQKERGMCGKGGRTVGEEGEGVVWGRRDMEEGSVTGRLPGTTTTTTTRHAENPTHQPG